MNKATEMTVPPESAGIRLDHFLRGAMGEVSRSRIQARIRAGEILLNDRPARPSEELRGGDRITVPEPPPPAPALIAAEEIPLSVLFEDEALLVIDKPAGLVVHPGAGNSEGTLVNALLHHCRGLSSIGGVERPGIVHRLDKETSGCLVVAKSDAAHHSLARQFAGREVKKTYIALVEGRLRHPHGEIDAAIGRHPVHRQKMAVHERGRPAQTHYRLRATDGSVSLVECHPRTGRTHQIRVHLKHLGHAILGDPVYGRRGTHTRHFLHAWKIGFKHPTTGRDVSFEAALSPDFPEWARAALAT
ncbi:MAG: RluA family pseudouridine synthase [Terrimicrobiaceae bacterium]|nr:RluA family pseudouridine synthase [Terrimicrobiaceae bacterium]